MQAKSPKIALYTEKQINAPRDMRGVSPVCVYRAWTPSLADRQMPYRFFCIYRVCNRAQTIICYKWKEQKRYARFLLKAIV